MPIAGLHRKSTIFRGRLDGESAVGGPGRKFFLRRHPRFFWGATRARSRGRLRPACARTADVASV
jgi:hypothetical protein